MVEGLRPTYGRARSRAMRHRSTNPAEIARTTREIPTLVAFHDKTTCDLDRGTVRVSLPAVRCLSKPLDDRLDQYISARLKAARASLGDDA